MATAAPEKKKVGTSDYVDAQRKEREKQSSLEGLAITDRMIQRQFGRLPATEENEARITRIYKAGAAMAQVIKNETLNCADQSAAIRSLREACKAAEDAVILQGK